MTLLPWPRAAAVAAVPVLAASVWAGPALLRSRVLRTALLPRMAGQGRPDHVALTFDDGPDPRGTPAVLEVLAELGWRATFFMLGSQVAAHPRVAVAVADAGHEIAVHGYSHRNHLARGPRAIHRDVERACDQISTTTGQRPSWFRPPYGVLTAASLTAARAQGLDPVLWTAWGRDWLPRPASQVAQTVCAHLRGGGTILLHDSDCTATSQTWRATAQALPLLADRLACLRLQVGPLGEHFVDSC